ncbi:OLC1v1015971C1 [Oldenlandia corymbosa var. corymbosa]|uniref:OLC1v1015971C1 n=1 Tax=Oldenlandia corymbosa var. corymbosa TaxID=529605 RepID=A0AAV1E4L5_OLDCO|nr:OLC1v1015971C1 [Oldenlandia corymbosa var. corymbosa]
MASPVIELRIATQDGVPRYLRQAKRVLARSTSSTVKFSALSKAITKAVFTAELLKHHIRDLHQNPSISSFGVKLIPALAITLSHTVIYSTQPGYQSDCQVKPRSKLAKWVWRRIDKQPQETSPITHHLPDSGVEVAPGDIPEVPCCCHRVLCDD